MRGPEIAPACISPSSALTSPTDALYRARERAEPMLVLAGVVVADALLELVEYLDGGFGVGVLACA